MDKKRASIIFFPLLASILALGSFFRMPGAESVRVVEILTLFASGLAAGVALSGILLHRRQNT